MAYFRYCCWYLWNFFVHWMLGFWSWYKIKSKKGSSFIQPESRFGYALSTRPSDLETLPTDETGATPLFGTQKREAFSANTLCQTLNTLYRRAGLDRASPSYSRDGRESLAGVA
jgi:hypothetical protein